MINTRRNKYYTLEMKQLGLVSLFFFVCIIAGVYAAPKDTELVENTDEFKWEWSDDTTDSGSGDIEQSSGSAKKTTTEAIDVSAYNDLVKENLKLRRQLAEKERMIEETGKKLKKMESEKNTLEEKIKSLAETIDNIEKEKSGLEDNSARVQVLNKKLQMAEKEKAALQQQSSQMQKALEELRLKQQSIVTPGSGGVSPGSDLYAQLEKNNAKLKEALAKLEAEHAAVLKERDKLKKKEDSKAVKAEKEADKLRNLLDTTKTSDEQQRKLIKELLKKLPAMEEELAALRQKVDIDQNIIQAKEKELADVKEELKIREHRLIKAEKMAAMLDEVQKEAKVISDTQARDMHYNMAVVYAKEGKSLEAEKEYLQALRIDPLDAASHYNLAILYDDELHNTKRAIMHYKQYLKLRPDAPDADEVRQWIMQLEMK